MRKRAFSRISLLLLALSIIGCAGADVREKPMPVITAVDIMDNAVRLDISGEFTYIVYSSDPFNVVIDLPGVGMGDIEDQITSDKAGISEVTVTRTDGLEPSTKVEILLSSPAEMESEYTDNALVLRVERHILEDAVAEVWRLRKTYFDPNLVDLFMKNIPHIRKVYLKAPLA